MGGVGLISPLEFLQLQLVIGFLDLLVQSARICQLIYPSNPFKCASLIRGERPRPPLKFSLVLSDGYKAQMAHVKALNKAKNKNIEEGPESPHHTPITGRGRNDSDDEGPVSQLFS